MFSIIGLEFSNLLPLAEAGQRKKILCQAFTRGAMLRWL